MTPLNTETQSPPCGIAIFTCCQQSHPFEERRIPLTEEPNKIGRSVARIRPGSDNAIFDCKVLSRNHAVVWYEDGKFYLKDTKSSNGTFVNNQRLSKGSEESPPKELYSGDIVQFGVDIVENSKKVTHGCIVAMIRLFHPDGHEAIARNSPSSDPLMNAVTFGGASVANVGSQELFQLYQYVKEAAYREQQLELKLTALQTLLMNTQDASDNSWQALIDEDRLLSRIELLESQLQMYSKGVTDDKLREELSIVHEEKHRCECQAKESLRKALEEKIEAMQKLADVERSLENTEDECGRLRSECEFAQSELHSLMHKYSQGVQELQRAMVSAEEMEKRYQDVQERWDAERDEYESKLSDDSRQESILTARIEALQNENDLFKEQIAAMKVGRDRDKLTDGDVEWERRPLESSDDQVNRLQAMLKIAKDDADGFKERLSDAQTQLQSYYTEVSTLKERLFDSESRLSRLITNTTNDVRSIMNESTTQKHVDEGLCKQLEERIAYLEQELLLLQQSATDQAENRAFDANIHENMKTLQDELTKAIQAQRLTETEAMRYREEFEHMRSVHERSQEELLLLRRQISEYQSQSAPSAELTNGLERRRPSIEQTEEFKAQIVELQLLLKESQNETEQLKSKLRLIQEELEFERSLRSTTNLDSDNARIALHRQAAKNQSEFANMREECVTLKNQMEAVERDMKTSRKENHRLKSENQRLQEALQGHENFKPTPTTEQQGLRDVDLVNAKLQGANDEIGMLRRCKTEHDAEITRLRELLELSGMEPYEGLADQTRSIAAFSFIPLLLLGIAFIAAYLPFFAWFTATTDDAR